MPFWNVFHARTSIAHALTGGSHSREKELKKKMLGKKADRFFRVLFSTHFSTPNSPKCTPRRSLSLVLYFIFHSFSALDHQLHWYWCMYSQFWGKLGWRGGRWEGTINSSSFSFASLCQCLFGAYMTYTTDSGTFLCWLGWRRRRRRRRFVGLGLGWVGSGLGNLLPFSTCSHSLSFFLQWNVFVQLDAPGLVWFMTHIAIAVLVHQKWQKQ